MLPRTDKVIKWSQLVFIQDMTSNKNERGNNKQASKFQTITSNMQTRSFK